MISNNQQFPNISKLIDSDKNVFISNIYSALKKDFEKRYDEVSFSYEFIDSGGSNHAVINATVYAKRKIYTLNGDYLLDGSILLKS